MGILGIASGTDWNTYIDQLVAIERRPLEKLYKQRDKLEYDRSVMTTINQQLTKFNTTLSNMRFESTFLSRLVESSNSGRVSATTEAGAAEGSYNIETSRLARASRASSGLAGEIYSKIANLSTTQTMGIQSLVPYDDFQPTRALESTLIKNTTQAGASGARITAGDTITITGSIKDGTPVTGTFTFAGDETDTLQRLATTIAQVFQGEIAAAVGSNGELVFIETDPSVAGDVTFNTTIPPLDLQFHDVDYSGSTLDFGIGNIVAGAAGTNRRLVNDQVFTSAGALELSDLTDLATLDQVTGSLGNGDIIRITGTESGGTAITTTDFTYTGAAGGQTIADLISSINTAFTTATATYENGRIVLTDNASGASLSSISLSFIDQGVAGSFDLGTFSIAESGRDNAAQMITTSSFTTEGKGQHLLSSTEGKAGRIRGNLTLPDPSNTLESFGVTEFDMLTIDPDGAGGPLDPVTITGLSEYSTLQDLVDAINEQVPTVTAQLVNTGSNYVFELTANTGGQDFRVYDDTNGILQILGAGNPTDLDTSAADPFTFAATTDPDDITIIDWFQPDNGGPAQRRIWTGDDGTPVQDLIGGVAITSTNFREGVASIVTTNSSELNTQQAMHTYLFGSNDIVANPPAHYPPFDPSLTLAAAGFATTPQNSDISPLFHTDGFFTINGVRINVGDVDAMTVNELLGAINTSGAGVSASFDMASGRFALKANTTGPTQITVGGGGDTSNFLQLAGLTRATGSTQITGQQADHIDAGLPAAQGGFSGTLTSGVFTINNTKITIDVGVDTLDEIIAKINRSGAGVTASYDATSDSFTLAQNLETNPTAYRITVGSATDTSNFLEAVQLTVDTTVPELIGSVRQTAQFTINGVAYTRNSNSVSDVIDKVKLSLNALTDGPETITVTADTERMEKAVVDFIVEFNKTMEMTNGKPLSREERSRTAELTNEDAQSMTVEDIESYLVQRDELLIRDFVSRDSSVRQISQKLINLIQGPVSNSGIFKSMSQIGLSTSEVGGGPDAAAVSLGRLLAPTSDRETLTQFVQSNSSLQDAILNNSDELFTMFANVLESMITHQGSRDMSSGMTVNSRLEFTIGDGTNTAQVVFNAGTYTQNIILNRLNQQLNSAGLGNSILAYYDANNQMNLRVAKKESQAYLDIRDNSTGSDSLSSNLGMQQGIFFGPDPNVAGGVAMRTRKYISDITTSGGIVIERLKQNGTFDRQIGVYTDAIGRQEARLSDYESRLRSQFSRLEVQLSQLQAQQQSIEGAIARMQAETGTN